ncbi:MAG: RdgB/HAM1 family non-canonical purine NTP pyrophosphatase [Oscillospiraceae bacterium]|jgi:XTP/dITP diphosphohydrolase|nr:RdgB/HAM1 family non-canonical purine NTP pyrophosphatase [Oscillospiraceae bacterium]
MIKKTTITKTTPAAAKTGAAPRPEPVRPTLLLATNNRHKACEMSEILSPLGFDITTPEDIGLSLEIKETGETFEENARLKARAFAQASGLPSIADDSGLCVAALGWEPGVRSARFGGAATDEDRRRLLLEIMESGADRFAKFVTVIAGAFPDGTEIVAEGEQRGELLRAERGESGFGYDPVFYYPKLRKTNAEMTPEEKNSVSARGKALRALAKKLKKSFYRKDV